MPSVFKKERQRTLSFLYDPNSERGSEFHLTCLTLMPEAIFAMPKCRKFHKFQSKLRRLVVNPISLPGAYRGLNSSCKNKI